MTEIGSVKMYFGTASGSARKALQKMEEPDVMLSAQSKASTPWEDIDNLFLDSGGYSLMIEQGEHPPVDDYLDTVEEYGADMFAVQDYPCEPEILDQYGRSVRDHQRPTTVAAAECLVRAQERGIDAEPVVVVQGWTLDDYISHLEELYEEDLLTEHIGIGSVCRRNQATRIQNIIKSVKNWLPEGHKLHAFGVKNQILRDEDTRKALHSADTTAWYYRNYDERNDVDDTWQEMVTMYLDYRRRLAELSGELEQPGKGQTTLMQSVTATDGGSETED